MTPPRSTSRPRPRHSRRGITLLEVLLAVLLMSLTVASVMGAVSSIAAMESGGQRRLEANEIANRLMLQYLDDDRALPEKSLPITYGDHRYFWELDQTPARMVINRKQESAGASLQAVDRFRLIGVTVYDADRNGNFETRGEPLASLSRVIDPFAPRNPDTLETFDAQRIGTMVHFLTEGGAVPTGSAALQGRQLR